MSSRSWRNIFSPTTLKKLLPVLRTDRNWKLSLSEYWISWIPETHWGYSKSYWKAVNGLVWMKKVQMFNQHVLHGSKMDWIVIYFVSNERFQIISTGKLIFNLKVTLIGVNATRQNTAGTVHIFLKSYRFYSVFFHQKP